MCSGYCSQYIDSGVNLTPVLESWKWFKFREHYIRTPTGKCPSRLISRLPCFCFNECLFSLASWSLPRIVQEKERRKHKIQKEEKQASAITYMITSSNEKKIRVTGPLWGESPVRGNRWSPVDSLTQASDAELWCFLLSAPEQIVKQTIETPVIWDAITLIMTSL